ncbi:hypothetical protein HOI26_04660, partial [Candidatus Woesearchaeota archaeon]|nr:hypothetical protein [Candidatus Woesearchaeota archaeon]
MPTLTPFYSNVQVYEHKGRFPVQLEVPEHSTLTSDEIEQILELASWDSNPNKRDDILFEGGRSFLFPGKNERNVQLGGTSYLPIHYIPDFIGFGYIDRAPGVLPPSTKNYIDCLPGNIMGTSFGEGWNLCHSRPTYRATGSYTEPELREK